MLERGMRLDEFEEWAVEHNINISILPKDQYGRKFLLVETELLWQCWQAAQNTPKTPQEARWRM